MKNWNKSKKILERLKRYSFYGMTIGVSLAFLSLFSPESSFKETLFGTGALLMVVCGALSILCSCQSIDECDSYLD